MKLLSEIIMAIGIFISMLAMCALDSPGAYMYYAGAVCILGLVATVTGYWIRLLVKQRRRKWSLCDFHQADRLDGDVVWIEEGDDKNIHKNSTAVTLASTGAIKRK